MSYKNNILPSSEVRIVVRKLKVGKWCGLQWHDFYTKFHGNLLYYYYYYYYYYY
jgi:hypothetical protein